MQRVDIKNTCIKFGQKNAIKNNMNESINEQAHKMLVLIQSTTSQGSDKSRQTHRLTSVFTALVFNPITPTKKILTLKAPASVMSSAKVVCSKFLSTLSTYGPRRDKTCLLVSEKVRFKPARTVTETI